jgi:glycosyltransferase involved in cell wall biosynthesis
MRLALVTDAWQPQVNGVVRTLENTVKQLRLFGHDVLVIHPGLFTTIPCPGYTSIKLAIMPYARVKRLLNEFDPQAIHLPTEGPLGLAGRKYCMRKKLPFTSSFHTHFSKYLKMYYHLPEWPPMRFMRWFHHGAVRTLVPTASVRDELQSHGFEHMVIWGRGIDTDLFHPNADGNINLQRPILLNVGRVAREKNIAAFCQLGTPGTKVVVGDGPQLKKLRKQFPQTTFTGYLPDEQMAAYYAAADVFVFPSRTDTFGNVMLEAMACGTPVAAYAGASGPTDVLQPDVTGAMHDDLSTAIDEALQIDPAGCRAFAESIPWSKLAREFEGHLEVFG